MYYELGQQDWILILYRELSQGSVPIDIFKTDLYYGKSDSDNGYVQRKDDEGRPCSTFRGLSSDFTAFDNEDTTNHAPSCYCCCCFYEVGGGGLKFKRLLKLVEP